MQNRLISFKRGKDKKKRKRKSKRNETLIAVASIGSGARIGGIHGFIRGRGGLGGTVERVARDTFYNDKNTSKKFNKKQKTQRMKEARALDARYKIARKDYGDLVDLAIPSLKEETIRLNKKGRKMAMKHAALGAGIGAAGYGTYRAIKALRNRKAKK